MSADPSAAATGTGTGARILVVEDSPTQAAVLAALLEEHGYTTMIAGTGERALELVAGGAQIDLVLSDVLMPGVSGYDVCRRIKRELRRGDLPVVLLTSLNDPLAIVRGLESGADNYVTKPYVPERLLERVAHAIAEARSPREQEEPVVVTLHGSRFYITAGKEQILALLVSSYEDVMQTAEAVREAEQRARFLAEAGETLSASLEPERVLRELAQLAVPAIADWCAVDLLVDGGALQRVELVHADRALDDVVEGLCCGGSSAPDSSDGRARSPVRAALARQSVELLPNVTPEVLATWAGDEHHGALVRALAPRSLIIAPLIARDEPIGVLLLATAESGRVYGDDDRALAGDLARRAALAVENARLYRAAQQATRARDDVLGIVSHDLRNPIHTIQMSTSLLLEMLSIPGATVPIVPQLNIIRRQGARANALIQDLLDITRIDAGSLTVRATAQDAAALIDDAVSDQAAIANEKSIALRAEWTGAPVTVSADRDRIAQLFSNLVGNAVKFTAAGGSVTVRGEAEGADGVRFAVRDTGSGIPADQLPHLFDRFWQARSGTREGAGLGLSIAKGIVEAHGSQLRVESTVGEGTTFSFVLAVAPDATGTATA